MEYPQELKYTKEHEWVRLEGDIAYIGITDYAQHALGDIVFLEVPEVGSEVEKGETFGVVESVKAVSDLYAPLTGEVTEANEELVEAPEMMNEHPYDDGWVIAIKIGNEKELEELMDVDAYTDFLEENG